MNLREFRLSGITPLLVNGYALVANTGISALLGIVFWIAGTRLYSQHDVGLAAALISSMTTISYFSQMNLSSFLTRFLPSSGSAGRSLIVWTYAVSGLVAAIVAAVFALGIGSIAEPLAFIRENVAALIFFVVATVLWTVFALQDAALSGLRRSAIVPVENTIYAVLKIGLLVILGVVALPTPLGIFLAWTIPLIPIVVVTNLIIFRDLPSRQPDSLHRGPNLRTVSNFVGWDFLGSLALGSGFGLATLMVTAEAGLESTATYQLAWSFTYSVYLLGRAMSVSLVAEGANHPTRLRRLTVDTLTHTLLLVLSTVVILMSFAPQIMGLFGPAYVEEGAPLVRVLVLACLPWAVTTIYCAVARVRRQTRIVAIVQIATLVVLAAVSSAFVGDLGALGVAFGWLAAHTAVFVGIVVWTMVKDGFSGPIDWLLAMTGSAMRLMRSFAVLLRPFASPAAELQLPPEVREVIGLSSFRGTKVEPYRGSVTDSNVLLLKADGQLLAVLKYSLTDRGIAELERNARALKSLAEEAGIGELAVILPRILTEARWNGGFCTIETAAVGTEGRAMLFDSEKANAAMGVAVFALSELHRRTSRDVVIDEAWTKRWVDAPIDEVRRVTDRSGPWAATVLEAMRAELGAVFVGRQARLGHGHGDAWFGNMFFASAVEKEGELRLSGLIDWGGFSSDALAAVDSCHLALTMRMEQRGEEIGPVICGLLHGDDWSPEDIRAITASGLDAELGPEADRALSRALLILTWLSHVSTVIVKSERAQLNWFWSIMNVHRVLSSIERTKPKAGS